VVLVAVIIVTIFLIYCFRIKVEFLNKITTIVGSIVMNYLIWLITKNSLA